MQEVNSSAIRHLTFSCYFLFEEKTEHAVNTKSLLKYMEQETLSLSYVQLPVPPLTPVFWASPHNHSKAMRISAKQNSKNAWLGVKRPKRSEIPLLSGWTPRR